MLRTEPLNRHKLDQAESAILEFVDGKVDTRFVMTAAAVARAEKNGWKVNPTTMLNVKKVTAFRKDGKAEFRAMVKAIKEQVPRELPKDLDNVDYHFEKLRRRQAAADAEAEAEAAAQAAAAMAADADALDRFKEEDFDVKERRGGGEGRGMRQRRRRREETAAQGGEMERETTSDWEDLEEAAEAQANTGGPATLKSSIKRALRVKRKTPRKVRLNRSQPRAKTEEASF